MLRIFKTTYLFASYFLSHLLVFIIHGSKSFISGSKISSESCVAFIKVDALGDFIIWLNCAKILSQTFSTKSKVLVCSKQAYDLAQSLNLFDIIISVDQKKYILNPIYRLLIYNKLNSFLFEDLFQCNHSRSLWLHDDLAFVINSKHKIAPKGDWLNSNKFLNTFGSNVYTQLIPNNPRLLNHIHKNYWFLEQLGLKVEELKPSLPKHLCTADLEVNVPFFIVFLGASVAYRRWQPDKFAQLANYINEKTGWLAILCGIQNELYLADVFEKGYKGKLLNLIGKTSLLQFIELSSKARLLIGNDTSSVHIASAVDTPSIALVGGGHYGHFLPYPSSLIGTCHPTVVDFKMDCFNCNWKCPYVKSSDEIVPCVSSIKVNDAKTAFDDMYFSLK